jgi:hypothetical protein
MPPSDLRAGVIFLVLERIKQEPLSILQSLHRRFTK